MTAAEREPSPEGLPLTFRGAAMVDLWFLARALGLGSLIGFSLGALGAGGSILTVPVLVYAMGVPVHSATGTSLVIVGLNAVAGALDYIRRGRSLPRVGLAFGGTGLLGALGGVWLNHQLPGELILVFFSVLMIAAAFSMLRVRMIDPGSTRHPAHDWRRLAVLGMAIGLLSGFFGIGGGFLIVPALVVVVGLSLQLAVGTSLLVIALNALWGLLGNLQLGTLDWGVSLPFALGGIVGVLVGGRVAGHLPERSVRSAFAVVIVLVAIYTFSRNVLALF
jgi:uncharacterized protein